MKIDFHIHTSYSYDGISSPREVVDAAIEQGLDAICITDHDQIQGAVEALKYAFTKPILIIPGLEVTTKDGDVLAINTKKKITSGLSSKETIKRIRKQGGIAVIAHPFAWPYNFWRAKREVRRYFEFNSLVETSENGSLSFDGINGIEVLNAAAYEWANQRALNFAQKYNLPFTAGSDAHLADFVGKAYVELDKDDLTSEEIIQDIEERKVKVVNNVNLQDRVRYYRNYFRRMEKLKFKKVKDRYYFLVSNQTSNQEVQDQD